MSERRNRATGGDGLRPKQREAINCLVTGMTQTATAEAINVHRVTVSNWIRKDPSMRAELNRRHQERADATSVRVQGLVEASLDVLEESIKRDRDTKAAGAFLRLVGPQGYLGTPPTGPATFEAAALVIALELSRRQDAFRLVFGDQEPPPPGLPQELIGNMSGMTMNEGDPTRLKGGER